MLVPEGSPLHGRGLREVPAPDGALVAAVVRDVDVVVPRGATRLRAGDLLIVTTVDRDQGIDDVERWAQAHAEADVEDGRLRSRHGE
ncbi:MAG TPA: TrkA C-terminal domain-containing protein [Euzebyales bacterium]